MLQLGITDSIQDGPFEEGQLQGARDRLHDQIPNWLPVFKDGVHGVLVIAGDSQDTIDATLSDVERILGLGTEQATIREVFRVTGNVRPDLQRGHEQYVVTTYTSILQ